MSDEGRETLVQWRQEWQDFSSSVDEVLGGDKK